MGNDILKKIIPGLPLVIAKEIVTWLVIAILLIELIKFFC